MVKDDIIICIHEIPNVITLNKQYVVVNIYDQLWNSRIAGVDVDENTYQVCIECDRGFEQVLNSKLFLTLQEYRDKKLKDIL